MSCWLIHILADSEIGWQILQVKSCFRVRVRHRSMYNQQCWIILNTSFSTRKPEQTHAGYHEPKAATSAKEAITTFITCNDVVLKIPDRCEHRIFQFSLLHWQWFLSHMSCYMFNYEIILWSCHFAEKIIWKKLTRYIIKETYISIHRVLMQCVYF